MAGFFLTASVLLWWVRMYRRARALGRSGEGRASFRGYLYGIARFQVLRKIQRERTMVSIDDDETDFAEDKLTTCYDPLLNLTREETVQSVRDAILVLPPHYREVVVLCDLHEMSYQDAAQILDCAIGTVRSRLHRARAILVQRLRGLNPEVNSRQTATVAETVQCFV